MARSSGDVLLFLSDVYAAGCGERSWTSALESLATAFNAAGATVYDLNRATGAIPTLYVTEAIDGTQSDYIERMNAINPRMHNALARSGCFVTYDYDALPEQAIRRHEFYDWLGRECGLKYHVGSRMINDGDASSFVSVEFAEKHGHVQQHEIELLKLITPHIANAWRMSRCIAQASRVDDFNIVLLESAAWGVVTLDRHGCVLSINAPARRLLKRNDGLRIVHGQLRALRAAEDRSLQTEIGLSLKSAQDESLHPGGTMAINRSGATVPYGVRVLPLRRAVGPIPETAPFVTVLISDPVQPGLPSHKDLMAIFGLTPREAESVLGLAQGLSVAEVGERMGIAPGTVNVHLGNAMAKTGAHSHATLTGLIRGMPAHDE